MLHNWLPSVWKPTNVQGLDLQVSFVDGLMKFVLGNSAIDL